MFDVMPFERYRAILQSQTRPRALVRVMTALLLAATVASGMLHAQNAAPRDPSPHSDAALVSDVRSVLPGDSITVAIRLTLDRGWHTYWTNPGDAGLPLTVAWQLPAGVTASALQFPVPHLTPQPPLMSYGYENEVFVLTTFYISPNATQSTALQLTGKADWLACADVCLPATATVSIALPISRTRQTGDTKWTAAIANTRAQLAQTSGTWGVRSWLSSAGYTLRIVLPTSTAATFTEPYFFVDSAGIVEYSMPQRVARSGDTLLIELPPAKFGTDTARALTGVVTADLSAASKRGWAISVPVSAPTSRAIAARARLLLADSTAQLTGGVSTDLPVTTASAESAFAPLVNADMSFIVAIAFAFIGGLLLNLMPCVFPVLSVKVLSLIEHSGDANTARVRRHGLAFGVGVLLSFWILAGALMILRAGGEQLGWGFQLQSPLVVGLLALLMFALGLNLSGVFEIGMSLTRLGSAGAGRGYSDSLLTGGLAVLVAAPCTAPFMGAALGYALVQPALVGMLVFTALAIGLALPFVLLTAAPQLLRFLPRPGPWLETLKQLFAFPLYATVVWLLWVFGQQAGIDALAVLLLAMIVFALGAWTWARGVRLSAPRTRTIAALIMVAALSAAWYGATRPKPVAATEVVSGWESYSAERVRELRAENRAIFIDFTAAWCLSCQVNERVALQTAAVKTAFRRGNVALLRADWTSRDSAITNALASFGRSGVPLYVLYPATKGGTAEILPAVLTPSIVLRAIERAAPATLALHPVR
jgi:thiol:disulfide interchange protein